MNSYVLTMSEDQLQELVLDYCALRRLLTWHDHDSRRNTPGLPDLLIIGTNGALWRELKTTTGRLRPAQRTFLDALTVAGHDADVWRPHDWHVGRIRRELEAIR